MNADQFFTLLNETDNSYLAAAHKSMNEKPARAWFRPALIAACLTLVLVAIPVGIMIGNRTVNPSVPVIHPSTSDNTVITTAPAPPTTQAPITTEKPKASVLDIPGATVFDENNKNFQTTESLGSNIAFSYNLNSEQTLAWAKRIQKENKAVLGIVKSYTSVLVPDGKAYYRITTMEIAVLEDYSGIDRETITAVYANRYEWDSNRYIPVTKYIVGEATHSLSNTIVENFSINTDMFEVALKSTKRYSESYPCATLFLLKDSKDSDLTLGANSYPLSNYADYMIDACLNYLPDNDAFSSPSVILASGFRSNLIREIFLQELSLHDLFGYLFTFENDHEGFKGHTALVFRIPKFVDRIYETDSIFSESLFIQTEDADQLKINSDYKWMLTVDQRTYEITCFDLMNTSATIEVYLDLDFDFSEEEYENIRLDIYDSEGNLLCYAFFPKTDSLTFIMNNQ